MSRTDIDPRTGGGDLPLPTRVLDRWLGGVCTVLLVGMAGLTLADVILRYGLNSPVPGAFEITQLMLATLIFSALPLTTGAGDHVEVDIFYGLANNTWRRIMRVLGDGISCIALSVISWRLLVHANKLFEDGSVTNELFLPLAPVGWIGAATALLSAILAFLRLIAHAKNPDKIIKGR